MPPVHGMPLGSQLRAEICPHRGRKPRAPSPGAKAEHGVCLYPCSGCTAPSPWNPHTINVILGTQLPSGDHQLVRDKGRANGGKDISALPCEAVVPLAAARSLLLEALTAVGWTLQPCFIKR